MKKLARVLAISTACSFLPAAPAQAQVAVACVNCGNEWTQLMNYGELLMQTSQSASQLATQVKQYSTMIRNLEQLPKQIIDELTSPYAEQIKDLAQLYKEAKSLYASTMDLYASTMDAKSSIDNILRGGIAMNLSPTDYLKYIAEQARSRGGVYQKMAEGNSRALENLQKTSASFQKAAKNVPNLQGNLDSLAQLNSLAAASGQVATEMLAVQRQAMAIQIEEKNKEEESRAITAEGQNAVLEAQRTEFQGLQGGFKVNKTWR